MVSPLAQNSDSKFIIHVPQGRSGRIDKTVEHDKVGSLFTYGIKTCQVVSFIGKERFSLMHVDNMIFMGAIDNELQWVGKEAKVIILYREEFPAGTILHSSILAHLVDRGVEHQSILLARDRDGIQLFSDPANSRQIHPHLTLHEPNDIPQPLLRHPLELQFITALKIEQFLSMGRSNIPDKKMLVYDGENWQKIPATECAPFCPTVIERQNLALMQAHAHEPMVLLKTIVDMAQRLQLTLGTLFASTPFEFGISIMGHVQKYVNDYDFVTVFRESMRECVEDRLNPEFCRCKNITISPLEREYYGKLLSALQQTADPYPEVVRLVNREGRKLNTLFSEQIAQEFSSFAKHYLVGKMYAQLDEKYRQNILESQREAKTATDLYQAGKYEEALEHFERSLMLARQSCEEGETILKNCYSGYGVALKACGNYALAERIQKIVDRLKMI